MDEPRDWNPGDEVLRRPDTETPEPNLSLVGSNGHSNRFPNSQLPNFQRSFEPTSDFPCPDAAAIAPCVCAEGAQNTINLDCTELESEDQLAAVFQQEFPVKNLNEFRMSNNSAILMLKNVFNGVSFESVVLAPGPFALASISEYFFLEMRSFLRHFQLENSNLISDSFPFATIPAMEVLETLLIEGSRFTWIPKIYSPTIGVLGFTGLLTDVIEPGTFDDVPKNHLLGLYNNALTELRAGTIPIRDGALACDAYNNNIRLVEPGAFYVHTNSTTSNHLIHIDLNNNVIEFLLEGTFPLRKGVVSISVTHNKIEYIEPGTFVLPDDTGLIGSERIFIDLSFNSLTSLRAGTFPFRDGPMSVLLYANQITALEPGTFVLPQTTDSLSIVLHLELNALTLVDEAVFGDLMPFMTDFRLNDNPLICGCDIAWLVLNPVFLAKIDSETKCANGTALHDLDPQAYVDFC